MALSVLLIVLLSRMPFTNCQDDPQLTLYFTDHGTTDVYGAIYRVDIHAGNIDSFDVANVTGPMAIDYDTKGEHVYWTDTVAKQIRRATKDGENDQVVAQLNATSSPEGLTLDSNTRQVFYTDKGEDVIVRIEMDTFESTVIVETGLYDPKGIVADLKNRKLYWVDRGTNEKIESCDYDGGQRRTVVKNGVVSPNGITLDQQSGRLYWADGAGHIDSILMDGSGRRRVFTETEVVFNDIAAFNGFLYVTISNYPLLAALPEDGSHLLVLESRKYQNPSGIHAFSTNFNVTNLCSNGQYGFKCEVCGKCYDGDICEKTTGACLAGCDPGYAGYLCLDECPPSTYGEECESVCSNCKTGTICDHITGYCPSGCQDGYKSDKCDEECGPNTYGNPCQDCGSCAEDVACDEVTGECPQGCLAGWEGALCKTPCPSNTHGACLPCGQCAASDNCDVLSGHCPGGCQPGWMGISCDTECTPGMFGENCDSSCFNCKTGTVCDRVTGKCPSGCVPGFKGDNCSLACPSNTFGPCLPCGHCASGLPCDMTSGYCDDEGCEPGWRGVRCDSELRIEEEKRSPTGLIVGICIGLLVPIAVIVASVVVCVIRRRRKPKENTYVELEGPRPKESDYSTLESTTTAGVVLNPGQLDQQNSNIVTQ